MSAVSILFLLAVDWIMASTIEGSQQRIHWTLSKQLEDIDFADDVTLLSHRHGNIWNSQTRSRNTSFIQFTLIAYSSANGIQASFTCVSRCAPSLPSVSVVGSDSIHIHPNTEIRRPTSIDYTMVPSRAVRSSDLFCGRADTVERPASRN